MNTSHPSNGKYQHMQIGIVLLVIFGVAQACFLVAWILLDTPALLAGFAGMVLLETCFFALFVTVDDYEIRLRFGIGLFRKSFLLSDIISCKTVRNSPLCGFGIKYIGRGWLYNVSGLDAVELELRDGRRARIGTDDPLGLLAAIQQRISVAG